VHTLSAFVELSGAASQLRRMMQQLLLAFPALRRVRLSARWSATIVQNDEGAAAPGVAPLPRCPQLAVLSLVHDAGRGIVVDLWCEYGFNRVCSPRLAAALALTPRARPP
jgi:hypothetical protein